MTINDTSTFPTFIGTAAEARAAGIAATRAEWEARYYPDIIGDHRGEL